MARAVSKVLHQRFCDVYVVCACARALMCMIELFLRWRERSGAAESTKVAVIQVAEPCDSRGRNAQGGYSNEA